MRKPFAWSYSSLMNYEICAKRYGHINVLKDVADADSQASADGKFIHTALYNRLIKNKSLPPALAYLDPTAKKFAAASGEKSGEMKLALSRDLEPVAYFDPAVWVRVVIDFLLVRDSKTVLITDWKTGKPKKDFTQMGLCAAVLAQTMPDVEQFDTALVFVGHKKIEPMSYSRADLAGVWSDLIPRVAKMEAAFNSSEFPATEGPLCGWCPVSQCIYWKDRG